MSFETAACSFRFARKLDNISAALKRWRAKRPLGGAGLVEFMGWLMDMNGYEWNLMDMNAKFDDKPVDHRLPMATLFWDKLLGTRMFSAAVAEVSWECHVFVCA